MLPNDYNQALASTLLPVFSDRFAKLELNDEFNSRLLFHKLIQISENYDVLPAAYRYLQNHLYKIDRYHSNQFLNEINPEKLSKQGSFTGMPDFSGLSSELLADALVHAAPVFLTEPVWLAGASQTATSQTPLVVDLTRIYLNLIQNEYGLAENRSVYCGYLLSQGRQLPDLTALAFIRQEKVCSLAFELAAIQLALTQFPRLFFGEILGFTLAYCSLASFPEIWLSCAENNEFGKFLRSGELKRKKAVPEVLYIIQSYLKTFELDQDNMWRRIQTGYFLYTTQIFSLVEAIQILVFREVTPKESAQTLILKLLPYAAGHHAKIKLENKSLDEWFKEKPFKSDEFFQALINSPLVDLDHPGNSKLLKLFEFEGPMFGVLDDGGIEILRTWLDSEVSVRKTKNKLGETKINRASFKKTAEPLFESPIALWETKTLARTEKLPDFSKLDNRNLFYYLVNSELYPEALPAGKNKTKQLLNQAKWLNPLPFKPYDHDAFESYINGIYQHETDTFQPLIAEPKLSKAALVWGIEQFAPAILSDGSWLQNMYQLAFYPNHAIGAYLDKIYHDETGQGNLKQNHPFIYSELLDSLGIELPPIFTREFCDHPGFINSSFDIPVFLMAISKFPSAFLPEILGLNMAIELSGLGKVYLRLSQELRYWGINPAIVDVHISIDNLATGHSALAIKAIQTYLDEVSAEFGNDILQAHWRRIFTGYCALQTVSYRFKFSMIGHYVFNPPKAKNNN